MVGIGKKLLGFFVCLCLCISLTPVALGSNATDVENFPDELQLANQLKSLGLFQGIGGNGEGTTDFNLGWELTREQAVVMLVRVLGKGAQAEEYPRTHPFTDVPAWADGYVSYAYDNGLTNGVSDTLFGAGEIASSATYLTFSSAPLGTRMRVERSLPGTRPGRWRTGAESCRPRWIGFSSCAPIWWR